MKDWIKRQQEIVDLAKKMGRELTEGEQKEFDELQAKIDASAEKTGEKKEENADDNARKMQETIKRMGDIAELCKQVGMDAVEFIREEKSMDEVRSAAVQHMLKHGAPMTTKIKDDDKNSFKESAVDALLMRAGNKVEKPTEESYKLRNMSLRDFAIECLAREDNGSVTELLRMSKDDLWNQLMGRSFYNPTAAFPAILDQTIKKSIVHQYNEIPTTFDLWCSKGSVTDFKETRDHNYLIGGAGEFKLVPESGELKTSIPQTELLPTRKVNTYGTSFSMSRQAFINDDINFVSEIPGLYAKNAKRTINKQVYEILLNNPTITDGVNLFATAHGNLVSTGSAPSIDTLQDMITMMLVQTDPFGESIMVNPKHIVVPIGYGFLLSQLLETTQIKVDGIGELTSNALNKYRNTITVIEEGTINQLAGTSAAPWFMTSDLNSAKNIQVDYLNGQETPSIRRMESPGQLGYHWDMWLDWGITVLDHRGIVKNPGVAL